MNNNQNNNNNLLRPGVNFPINDNGPTPGPCIDAEDVAVQDVEPSGAKSGTPKNMMNFHYHLAGNNVDRTTMMVNPIPEMDANGAIVGQVLTPRSQASSGSSLGLPSIPQLLDPADSRARIEV